MSLFGPIISTNGVEQAVKASLETWMPDYLAEVERQDGWEPDQMERPRGIVTMAEWDKWPEDQLPVVLVVSTGLPEKPVRRGDSSYEGSFGIGISPVVSDVNLAETRRLANTYVAAMRAAILQHKRLKSDLYPNGFASWLEWVGEVPISLRAEARTIAATQCLFKVGVESVVTEAAGPREPSEEPLLPPDENPEVEEIKVGAHPVTLTGSLA